MKPLLQCPTCGSNDINKNGSTRHGKQNYKCRDCGRQFVENPQWKPIAEDTKATLERMLLEKIPLAGIARSLQLSERWLQQYVNRYYQAVPQQVTVQPKTPQRLNVQMDELWSFVDDKGQEQWMWLALDVGTREIVGCYIGDGSERLRKHYGSPYPLFIDNVRSVTPIFGCPIQSHYRVSAIGQWARRVA